MDKNTGKKSITHILLTILVCLASLFMIFFGAGIFESYETEFESIPEEVTKPEITVYITGEVKNPGLYTLEQGNRVDALVEKAGGLTGKANVSAINMAKILKDGDHIKVSAVSHRTGSGSGKININCKNTAEYTKVSGITPQIAENIVGYINENGYITNIEELRYIPGIDETLYNKIKNKFII